MCCFFAHTMHLILPNYFYTDNLFQIVIYFCFCVLCFCELLSYLIRPRFLVLLSPPHKISIKLILNFIQECYLFSWFIFTWLSNWSVMFFHNSYFSPCQCFHGFIYQIKRQFRWSNTTKYVIVQNSWHWSTFHMGQNIFFIFLLNIHKITRWFLCNSYNNQLQHFMPSFI